jgi:multidrug resistance efflux pump
VTPIAIVDVRTLHVDVDINDVDIGKVMPGQPATLSADAVPDTRYSGKVTFIASSAVGGIADVEQYADDALNLSHAHKTSGGPTPARAQR